MAGTKNASFPSAVNVFSTTDLEGNTVTNDIFSQADLTVVNFWGTFCNPCIDEMPELAKWNEEMTDNVQMLGAIVDVETVDSDEYALAQQIVEKTGVTYENVIAPGAFDQFINKLAGVPTTVFIDKNGKVVGEAIVGAKVEEYKQQVADYLNEQK
ncbi:MAG: TlpA family protein disulfide reductase [Dorea formicigenerans]